MLKMARLLLSLAGQRHDDHLVLRLVEDMPESAEEAAFLSSCTPVARVSLWADYLHLAAERAEAAGQLQMVDMLARLHKGMA